MAFLLSWKVLGLAEVVESTEAITNLLTALLAAGESVIKRPSPLNVLKDTYDHSCY